MTDISVKEKKKKEKDFYPSNKKERNVLSVLGIQNEDKRISVVFLTCISEITFGHASYTVP